MAISEKQFIARSIKYQDVLLVNICDEELLGTTVKGDNVDMSISRDYFGGEKVSEDQAIHLVKGSSIVNLAGSRIVDKVLREKLASEKAVKRVGEVSFLMIYKFSK
ncbi:MAG: DUF424 family protein [Nitrososphaerota archaeon]|nr:DUF424 family protein [Nitrososphaerota archaeon]